MMMRCDISNGRLVPEVFHSAAGKVLQNTHIVLVRPMLGRNVGSVARAMANMGIRELCIVGSPNVIDNDARRLAKHAGSILDAAKHYATVVDYPRKPHSLWVAASARVGSPFRPHPQYVDSAMAGLSEKLYCDELSSLVLFFGPEGDGLTNKEVALCDWVVTIPASPGYRSLNLAQAVLIFCYELNKGILKATYHDHAGDGRSQKRRLIDNLLQLGEEVGFVLPNDPFKMRPKLEEILSGLPNHLKDVRTLHGFIVQIRRTLKAGRVDLKGRYLRRANTLGALHGETNKR